MLFVDKTAHKNRQEPLKSENDKVSVEDSLSGSEWFKLVPMVETASTVTTVVNDAVESRKSEDGFINSK